MSAPVPASGPLPLSPRDESPGAVGSGHTAPEPHSEHARACLHDEVVPALTAAMLRLHLLVETSEEARQLGGAAIAELERAAAGVQHVMAELSPH
jgi:hypothetical protein